VFPSRLSCDYSFNAIKPIVNLVDVRNLATALLYTCGAVATTWAWMRKVPSHLRRNGVHCLHVSDTHCYTLCVCACACDCVQHKQERTVLWAIGLIVLPFVPASNLLVYVGTTVGMCAPAEGFSVSLTVSFVL